MSSIIFTSNYALIGFVIALLCFAVAEQVGARIIPWLRRGGVKVQRRNVGSNTMVIVSWIIFFVAAVVLAKNSVTLLPDWVYYIGIAFMLAGIAFRQWAIAVLGRYFSVVIGVQKEQKVVEAGPYRLIRHPSYTGVLILYVGIGLAVQSLAAIFLGVILFGLVYGYRMVVEEKVLIRELGNKQLC